MRWAGGAGQPSGRWARPKHWVPTRGLRRRDLLLHHVPVLDNSPIGNSEDVDGDHRLWAPAHVAAMHHHQVTLRHRHARFILKGIGEAGDHCWNRPGTIGEGWVVLSEQAWPASGIII